MLRTVYRYNYGMKMTKKNFCGFFSCIFLMQVGGSQSYPCVCIADILYKGIYGKMCTRIIRCIWMIFPLTSSKYIQATNQSCWSEVWSTKLASKTQCAFDCGSTTIILIFSVLIIKKSTPLGCLEVSVSHLLPDQTLWSAVLVFWHMDRRWIKWNKEYLSIHFVSFVILNSLFWKMFLS